MHERTDDVNHFYEILSDLCQRVGGYRYLRDCSAKNGWPQRGVYFFLENGETRTDGNMLRVTRVGTHAVSANSKTTLWNRLHTHRGHSDGRGNHRGSIFRKRVGEALLRVRDYPNEIRQTWGSGSSATKTVRVAENPLERDVSRYIGDMPFLWLDVADIPSSSSRRAYIERNCIALLSNVGKEPIDPPSESWLGRNSGQPTVVRSGLWNSDYVAERYDPDFLKVFADLVALGKNIS
jgi:hypothetical protein